ncbi:MAG: VanZ family protein [Candidatus Nomurabacteria bacterium]|nr:MAG: VanZ family protein [Candidatus Nomurabacteria bacterium]
MKSSSSLAHLVSLWIPVLLWAGLIFGLSSIAGLRSSFPSNIDFILRKFAHATEFGILSALLYRALSQQGNHLSPRRLFLAFLLAALYAASDEWHQGFVQDRVPAWHDVGIDAIGAFIGADVLRHWYAHKAKQSR